MKNLVKANFRQIIGIAIFLMILFAVTTQGLAQGKRANPKVLPPQSEAYGMSYGEWSAAWWQWAFLIPADRNPLLDPTGANCAEGQTGKVWFLAGTTGGGPVFRSCNIPHGKALFFPIVNVSAARAFNDCSPDPNIPCDIEWLRNVARQYVDQVMLEVVVDGVGLHSLNNYRAQSPPFIATFPENAIFGVPAGIYSPVISDGYWIMLAPMSAGEHTVYFKGTEVGGPNAGFTAEATYSLTVGR